MFCDKHLGAEVNQRFKANLEKAKRDGRAEGNRFYKSQTWQMLRAYVLNNEPLCRTCQQPAQMVDHITPIHEGGSETDTGNLQPLCNACHASKRGREGSKATWRRKERPKTPGGGEP